MVKVIAICIGVVLVGVGIIAGVTKKAFSVIADFMDDSFRWG